MQLSKIEQTPAVAEPTTLSILSSLVNSGVTPENVTVIERLMALREREETRAAEKDFSASFVAMQGETGRIKAERTVPNNDGTTRYVFAAFEDIMLQIQPILARHGFAVAFDCRMDGDRVTSICKLIHRSGHTKSNEFQCRIGKGPPNASAAQTDGSASTYAKRFALCAALNIVVEKDDDAKAIGASIDAMAAEEIRERVRKIKLDEKKFLQWAGGATFEEIPASRMEEIHEMLDRKAKEKGIA